jgi:hypothetical protein
MIYEKSSLLRTNDLPTLAQSEKPLCCRRYSMKYEYRIAIRSFSRNPEKITGIKKESGWRILHAHQKG